MKGELTLREPVISYTGVATPLTIDDIATDIDEVQAERALVPGEIRMWEHQWDWLVKEVAEWDVALEADRRQVWGVPVVVMRAERPEQPAAVLEFSEPLTDEEVEAIRERFKKAYGPPFVQILREEQNRILEKARKNRATSK